MSIKEHEVIWFPGIYGGRTTPEYTQLLINIPEETIVKLVSQRAFEDGCWSIANNFVGDNEDKMRRMMAFAMNEENIKQCLEHLRKDETYDKTSVDWVCREMGNASKWVVG